MTLNYTGLYEPFEMILGGRGGELATVQWVNTYESCVGLKSTASSRELLGWVRYPRTHHPEPNTPATHTCVKYRIQPQAIELPLPTPMRLDEAQRQLIDQLENLPLDPLPIAGFDDLVADFHGDKLAKYREVALWRTELYDSLEEVALPLNVVATSLKRVLNAHATQTLTKKSAAVRAACNVLDGIGPLLVALEGADAALRSPGQLPGDLTHPVGRRLRLVAGFGRALLDAMDDHLPDSDAIVREYDLNLYDHRAVIRATRAWRGCCSPSELFAGAVVISLLDAV